MSDPADLKAKAKYLSYATGLISSLIAFVIATSSLVAGATSNQQDLGQIADKLANPLSDAWALQFQNDTSHYTGDLVPSHQWANSLKFQPVTPIPLFHGSWNLIMRPVLQLLTSPVNSDVGGLIGSDPSEIMTDPNRLSTLKNPFKGSTTGFADMALLMAIGPNQTPYIWGVGPTFIFPTASNPVLGQGKWQLGPDIIVGHIGDHFGGFSFQDFNLAILAQQWWSYAGASDRPDVSQSNIQYFINYRLSPTQFIGMSPNISVNWKASGGNGLTFPIGLGYQQISKLGKLPVSWRIEFQ